MATDIAQMAREAGLLHGPADDERARLMLAALGVFARLVRAATLEEAAQVCDFVGEHIAPARLAQAIRGLAQQDKQGGRQPSP